MRTRVECVYYFRKTIPGQRLSNIFPILFFLCLVGCESDNLLPYLLKQGFHQGALLLKAKDTEEVLKDPHTSKQIQNFLKLAEHVRLYAHEKVGMVVGNNYKNFIDIDKDRVTTIVTAAYPNRFEAFLFQYPLVGALPYKGFFDESEALKLEQKLKDQGLDTYVRPVEAFSTLGWLPDPLLSTMFKNPGRLIELLFHELTHASFYFKGEADFNEAFASWMGFKLALEYLENHSDQLSPFSVKPEQIIQELKSSYEIQKELAEIFEVIHQKAKIFYNSNSENPREIFFNEVKSLFKNSKNLSVRSLSSREWNNARLLAMSTYFSGVRPIEKYAKKNNLSPKDFLRTVISQGPSIIPEIRKATE
jgi:hypothetical protein